jgi:hypothetical protein
MAFVPELIDIADVARLFAAARIQAGGSLAQANRRRR